MFVSLVKLNARIWGLCKNVKDCWIVRPGSCGPSGVGAQNTAAPVEGELGGCDEGEHTEPERVLGPRRAHEQREQVAARMARSEG